MNIGFKLIREMSKEELIEEILAAQKEHYIKQDIDALKQAVITIRTHQVQHRLIEEADLEPPRGFFSRVFGGDDDD